MAKSVVKFSYGFWCWCMMRLLDNFLRYLSVNTKADTTSSLRPSCHGQSALCDMLKTELEHLNLKDIAIGKNGTLYAKLPAPNGFEHLQTLGFIAHVDTSDAFSGNVSPQIHYNYDGSPITFANSTVLDPKIFSSLKSFVGQTLITTDGTSLLGADDKAGVAEIMEMLYLMVENDLPRPPIAVAFTTDEEIGTGTDGFEPNLFGAAYAYTVDGGEIGSVEYETFNAASATVTITGVSVHPGSAKDIMVNAVDISTEFAEKLPKNQRPQTTQGYEGFIHIDKINAETAHSTLSMIIRDHDSDKFEEKKAFLLSLISQINTTYGNNTASIKIEDSYRNMGDIIRQNFHLIENAIKAINDAGLKETVEPIRGGTDGASLSFMGLPCPNLATGGHCFHGPFEHISLEAMQKSVEILCRIAELYSKG